MSENIKAIFSKFFLTSVIILCASFVAMGYVTVTEKSAQMSDGTDYAVVAAKSNNEKLEITVDEKTFDFDLTYLYETLDFFFELEVTPLSSLTYFFEVIASLFE
ncbi:MAG: hypothetical protein R3Y27_08175 [Clostridia bacterium]